MHACAQEHPSTQAQASAVPRCRCQVTDRWTLHAASEVHVTVAGHTVRLKQQVRQSVGPLVSRSAGQTVDRHMAEAEQACVYLRTGFAFTHAQYSPITCCQ